MSRLSNDEFVTSLQALLSNPAKTVRITQKRLGSDAVDSTIDDLPAVSSTPVVVDVKADTQTHPVLFRAKTDTQKISTVVEAEDLASFWPKYSSAIKNGFTGLKKTKKKKKKNAKK